MHESILRELFLPILTKIPCVSHSVSSRNRLGRVDTEEDIFKLKGFTIEFHNVVDNFGTANPPAMPQDAPGPPDA